MRPPICELCNRRFGRDGGELIDFAVDDETLRFDEGAAQPGFVGHRPNRGWFCTEHIELARERTNRSLADALAELRSLTVALESEADAGAASASEPPSPPEPDAELRVPPTYRRQRRLDDESGLVEEQLAVDVDVFELHRRLREFRPVLFAVLGLPSDRELDTRSKRTWNPMDGAREPNCPYTDRLIDEVKIGRLEQGIELESNWWNPTSLSNASARLYVVDRPSPNEWATYVVRIAGGTAHLIGEHISGPVHTLSVSRPDDSEVEACIADFARSLSGDPSAS